MPRPESHAQNGGMNRIAACIPPANNRTGLGKIRRAQLNPDERSAPNGVSERTGSNKWHGRDHTPNWRRYFTATCKSLGQGALTASCAEVTGWDISRLSKCKATRANKGRSSLPSLSR